MDFDFMAISVLYFTHDQNFRLIMKQNSLRFPLYETKLL